MVRPAQICFLIAQVPTCSLRGGVRACTCVCVYVCIVCSCVCTCVSVSVCLSVCLLACLLVCFSLFFVCSLFLLLLQGPRGQRDAMGAARRALRLFVFFVFSFLQHKKPFLVSGAAGTKVCQLPPNSVQECSGLA